MIPFLCTFLLLYSDPFKDIIPVRTYISNNVQGKYIIGSDIDGLICFKYKHNSFIDFLAHLIKLGVQFVVSGEYIFFDKLPIKQIKQNDD